MSIASNRVWQMRRVVITKDVISFAFVDEDAQIDYIPFAEILHVKEMADAGDDAEEDEGKYSHVMQIATRDDGYNSGRIYYLSTSSKEELDLLITELQSKAKKARMQAEAHTWFQMLQLKVRIRYESSIFQGLMALLIAAVNPHSLLHLFFPTSLYTFKILHVLSAPILAI